MNRNRRLTVLLLATLALLMLAGCSVLDPLLHPDHEVTGNPDERDTRFGGQCLPWKRPGNPRGAGNR